MYIKAEGAIGSSQFSEILMISILSVVIGMSPVVVHKIGIPIYLLNPMHLAIYLIVIFQKRTNKIIIFSSVMFPLMSTFISGHPNLLKALIIIPELILYGATFQYFFYAKNFPIFLGYLLSQILGRSLYYGLKYLLILTGLINGKILGIQFEKQAFFILISGIIINIYFYLKPNNRK
jgi:hypothetical protein